MEPLAFMAAILHTHLDLVEETLKNYNIGGYLICCETATDAHKPTNGQHMHFYVQMSKKDYHAFAKRLFKDKFNLRGQAKKNAPRQYGKLKKMHCEERYKMYCLKDQEDLTDRTSIRTNLLLDDITKLHENSFKKNESLTHWRKFLKSCTVEMNKEKDTAGYDVFHMNDTKKWRFILRQHDRYLLENQGTSLTRTQQNKFLFHIKFLTSAQYLRPSIGQYFPGAFSIAGDYNPQYEHNYEPEQITPY